MADTVWRARVPHGRSRRWISTSFLNTLSVVRGRVDDPRRLARAARRSLLWISLMENGHGTATPRTPTRCRARRVESPTFSGVRGRGDGRGYQLAPSDPFDPPG